MAKKFSPEEIAVMEAIYQGQSHSTPIQNQQLAQQFGKTPKSIAGWFRSRRRKDVKNGVTLQIHEITNNELHGLRSQLHLHRKRPGTNKKSAEEPVTVLPRIETILPTITASPPAELKFPNSVESAVKSDELFPEIQCSEVERPGTPSANLTESEDDSIDVLNITPEKEKEMIEADVEENAYVPLEEVPPPIPATVFYRRPLTQAELITYMMQQYNYQQEAICELQRRIYGDRH